MDENNEIVEKVEEEIQKPKKKKVVTENQKEKGRQNLEKGRVALALKNEGKKAEKMLTTLVIQIYANLNFQ